MHHLCFCLLLFNINKRAWISLHFICSKHTFPHISTHIKFIFTFGYITFKEMFTVLRPLSSFHASSLCFTAWNFHYLLLVPWQFLHFTSLREAGVTVEKKKTNGAFSATEQSWRHALQQDQHQWDLLLQ